LKDSIAHELNDASLRGSHRRNWPTIHPRVWWIATPVPLPSL